MNEKQTRRLPAVLRWVDRKSGLLTTRKNPWASWLLAFFLPILLMGIVWLANGVRLSGGKLILAHDQWHQYFPFFTDFRARLLGGRSMFYSWNTGMGTNYLSLYGYYLASPLNWLALLLPEGAVLPYYMIMTLIKIGCAGLFFVIFLQKTFERSEPVQVFFSTMYALCSFIMGYFWNAIWLDTVALLPLVALGTLKLLKERKFILYVAALALAVMCSYYIGLFICFFVVLLFIWYNVVFWDDLGGFWSRLWRIALFSLLALGICALITVPALLGLCSTSSVNNEFPKAEIDLGDVLHQLMSLYYRKAIWVDLFLLLPPAGLAAASLVQSRRTDQDKIWWIKLAATALALIAAAVLLGIFRHKCAPFADYQTEEGLKLNVTDKRGVEGIFDSLRLIFGNTAALAIPTSFNETLPNVACGATTVTLALAYFFCRRIPLREKLCSGLLLLFFAISFTLRQLDYVWHGFHFPNMLPFRYSFLFCFTALFMAYRAYTKLDRFRWYHVLCMLPAAALYLYCVFSSQEARSSVITTVIVVLTLAGLTLYALRREPRLKLRGYVTNNLLTLLLCTMLLAEAVCSAILGMKANGTTSREDYPKGGEDTETIVATMLEREQDTTSPWRADFTAHQTLNDCTFFSFPGVSVFSSACNSGVASVLESIGIGARSAANRYVYEQSDPAVNLLLGIKYLIDRDGKNADPAHFTQVAQSGDVLLLENNDYLPMGWVVDPQVLGYDPEMGGTPFDRLTAIYSGMLGSNLKLYETVLPTEVTYAGKAEGSNHVGTSYTFSSDGDNDSRMSIHFTAEQDGQMSLYTKSWNAGSAYLYINDEYQCYYNDKYGCLRFVGAVQAGDRVTVRYRVNDASKSATVHVHAAMFDEAEFQAVRERLSSQTLNVSEWSDTEIAGMVTAKADGLLFTSIPYEKSLSETSSGLISAVLPLELFDGGWSVTVDGKPVRVQPMGGAFVCFHVTEGTHEIRLTYETPGFSPALLVSAVSLALFLTVAALYLIFRLSRRPMDKVAVQMAGAPAEQAQPEAAEAAEAAAPIGAPELPDDGTITFPALGAEDQPPATMPTLLREELADAEELDLDTLETVVPEDLQLPEELTLPEKSWEDDTLFGSPWKEEPEQLQPELPEDYFGEWPDDGVEDFPEEERPE